CFFLIKSPSEKIKSIIYDYGQIIDLDTFKNSKEIAVIKTIISKNDILVLDGYVFDFEYQKELSLIQCKIVIIDDLASGKFCADLIINHGRKSLKGYYLNNSNAKVLTGLDYLMIRKNFLLKANKS